MNGRFTPLLCCGRTAVAHRRETMVDTLFIRTVRSAQPTPGHLAGRQQVV
jgi:hypothetical protein